MDGCVQLSQRANEGKRIKLVQTLTTGEARLGDGMGWPV